MSRAPFHPSSVLSLRSRFTHLPTVGGRRTRKRSDRGEGRLDREVREAGERRNRGNPLAILLLPVSPPPPIPSVPCSLRSLTPYVVRSLREGMEWEAKSRERDRTPPLTSRLSPSHFAPWAGLRPMRRYGRREEAGRDRQQKRK